MATLMRPRGDTANLVRRQPVLTIVPGILILLNAVLAFVLTLVHLSPDSMLSARGIVNAVGVLAGLILAQRKVTPWPLIDDGRDDGLFSTADMIAAVEDPNGNPDLVIKMHALAGEEPPNDPATVADLVNTDNATRPSDGEQCSSVIYMTDPEWKEFTEEGSP